MLGTFCSWHRGPVITQQSSCCGGQTSTWGTWCLSKPGGLTLLPMVLCMKCLAENNPSLHVSPVWALLIQELEGTLTATYTHTDHKGSKTSSRLFMQNLSQTTRQVSKTMAKHFQRWIKQCLRKSERVKIPVFSWWLRQAVSSLLYKTQNNKMKRRQTNEQSCVSLKRTQCIQLYVIIIHTTS